MGVFLNLSSIFFSLRRLYRRVIYCYSDLGIAVHAEGSWLYSGIWISCATLIACKVLRSFYLYYIALWECSEILRRLSALTGLCLALNRILVYVSFESDHR